MAINPIPPIIPLNSINSAQNIQNNPLSGAGNGAAKTGSDFGQFLTNALNQVDALQKNADTASLGLATGQIQDVHTVMIALQKANLSLDMTVQVRNKVLDAYSEIMRMQM
ncbi:flagellar hook-basal body complex protein FliE [Desulfitobacterium sp.]|uniref:flagellar hook-basal body complex protein FliE n=1 Tax=Desulfitobacterium sp. TaxID=49981 RepID=UPI002BFF3BD0|nr:flagellar hook-basal body complex protein FliE [Desulfitobacterium sp.]HVJ49540.1 flagellar hook-basal body complex protein FliE [Desulfitobacterium sp.]